MPTMEPLLARLLRTAQAPLEATIESLRDPSLFGLLVHESPFHDLLMVERGPGATSLAASGTALQKQALAEIDFAVLDMKTYQCIALRAPPAAAITPAFRRNRSQDWATAIVTCAPHAAALRCTIFYARMAWLAAMQGRGIVNALQQSFAAGIAWGRLDPACAYHLHVHANGHAVLAEPAPGDTGLAAPARASFGSLEDCMAAAIAAPLTAGYVAEYSDGTRVAVAAPLARHIADGEVDPVRRGVLAWIARVSDPGLCPPDVAGVLDNLARQGHTAPRLDGKLAQLLRRQDPSVLRTITRRGHCVYENALCAYVHGILGTRAPRQNAGPAISDCTEVEALVNLGYKAAGVLLVAQDGAINNGQPSALVLVEARGRHGGLRMCLPGGKRDAGETIYATAGRELWEETGGAAIHGVDGARRLAHDLRSTRVATIWAGASRYVLTVVRAGRELLDLPSRFSSGGARARHPDAVTTELMWVAINNLGKHANHPVPLEPFLQPILSSKPAHKAIKKTLGL